MTLERDWNGLRLGANKKGAVNDNRTFKNLMFNFDLYAFQIAQDVNIRLLPECEEHRST